LHLLLKDTVAEDLAETSAQLGLVHLSPYLLGAGCVMTHIDPPRFQKFLPPPKLRTEIFNKSLTARPMRSRTTRGVSFKSA
jgi:hypothetical protein